jgi:peroxiredoxin
LGGGSAPSGGGGGGGGGYVGGGGSPGLGGGGGFQFLSGMFMPSLSMGEQRKIESTYVLFPDKVVIDAHDFTLANVLSPSPQAVRLRDFQKERQAVILVFWDADDPRCADVLQYLEDIHGYCLYYATQIVGICSDSPNSQRAVAKERDTDFPLCYDPGGKVAELYHVTALPTVMIVDPFGKRQEKYRAGCPEHIKTLKLVSRMTGYKYLSPDEIHQEYLAQAHDTMNGPVDREPRKGDN